MMLMLNRIAISEMSLRSRGVYSDKRSIASTGESSFSSKLNSISVKSSGKTMKSAS